MIATFVLRLLADRLSDGEVIGQVEHIGSGRTQTIRSAAEFEAFAQLQGSPDGDEAQPLVTDS
jgi:hypothetical protein